MLGGLLLLLNGETTPGRPGFYGLFYTDVQQLVNLPNFSMYISNGFFLSISASRSLSSGGGTNNLPPLLFHNVHGENVVICNDGIVAKRVDSFCKGIVFSSRPIKINEKVIFEWNFLFY